MLTACGKTNVNKPDNATDKTGTETNVDYALKYEDVLAKVYKDYVPRSYFAGATPDNNYEPSEPYTIKFFENPYARDNIDEGYLTLQVESGGADSPRQIRLRTKPSTGEWFLWEQFILSDIRPPKAADPWA